MLRSMHDLKEYAIHATDGTVGHVKDIYFDDRAWVVRYLVVLTGSWLANRKVLISPIAIHHADWNDKILPVSITMEQVKNSPNIDTDKPVSRQHEIGYLGYYNYPYYWGGAGYWGGGFYPGLMLAGSAGVGGYNAHILDPRSLDAAKDHELGLDRRSDPHLRSCKAVTNYHIEAKDGDIGHVSGLLIDEETWAIRYLIVDTSNWWMGHQVLIAPQWILSVVWEESTVAVDLTRAEVQGAPAYDASAHLNRDDEMGIYKHYSRSGYWKNEPKADETRKSQPA
jgi:hypothetical protein